MADGAGYGADGRRSTRNPVRSMEVSPNIGLKTNHRTSTAPRSRSQTRLRKGILVECRVKHTGSLDMGTQLDLTKNCFLPHLNLHELAEYACLGRAYPELTLDARIVAADRRGSIWCSPRTVRQADDRLRRVHSECHGRERRITSYIE